MGILYDNGEMMNLKNILVIFLVSWAFFWYTMVYSSFYKNHDVTYSGVAGKNMYVWDQILSKTIVVFKSKENISNYEIHSLCKIKSEFLYTIQTQNFFSVEIDDKNCKNGNFYLKDDTGNIILNTHFTLNILSDFDLYNKFTDYTDVLLTQASETLVTQAQKFKLFASTRDTNVNFEYVQKLRIYDEAVYQNKKIEEILEKRKIKYLVPIIGKWLPDGKNISKFPNWGRPYRASYTNAVHEGWDIDAPNGSKVVSIDDGVIVKIVNNFTFSDIGKIKKWQNLTPEDKLINLDILRGNQVWIKTMKWDVIFYAHLSSVVSGLEVWQKVKRGQYIWNTGITWVPDEDYKDYHLHFELKKNPYSKAKAGKNSLLDYMAWDWYFKWESVKYMLENQYKIFEK